MLKKIFATALLAVLPLCVQAVNQDSLVNMSSPKECCGNKDNHCHHHHHCCKEDKKCIPPCCPQERPQFGYFFVKNEQTLDDDQPVRWNSGNTIHSRGIFLDHGDHDQIILEKPGIYFASFIVTAEIVEASANGGAAKNEKKQKKETTETADAAKTQYNGEGIRFKLRLNHSTVRGSAYATPVERCEEPAQNSGQAVFFVFDRNSILQLVNVSCETVELENDVVDYCGENVSASIYIQKIADFDALDGQAVN